MPPSDDTQCRVAICDDVADFRRVLELLLETEPNMEVVGQASNGREAIELVTTTEVDVLLLDVAMPIMDGLEALPHVVAASPATAVVMLSGFGSAAQRQAEEMGAASYIEKGTPPNAMVDAIRDACTRHASR